MKFEAEIEAHTINGVLKAVQAVNDNCVLDILPDALSISVIDPANAMIIGVEIPSSVFSMYDVIEGQIGIDVDAVFSKTNTYSQDANVSLSWDDVGKKITISGEGC